MKHAIALLLLLTLVIGLIGCRDDEQFLPVDRCELVHPMYPEVPEDDCDRIADIILNFHPPTELPGITSSNRQLLAARVTSDTGSYLFVAMGVPPRFSNTCQPFLFQTNDNGGVRLSGRYCSRPPVDTNSYRLDMSINPDLTLLQAANGNRLCSYTTDDGSGRTTVYRATNTANFRSYQVRRDSVAGLFSGFFEVTLHNTRDASDSIRLEDGRFTMNL